MPSPVTSEDFKAVIPDSTASKCAGFVKALLKLPTLIWQFVDWMLDDDGNLSAEFKQAIQPTGTYEFAAAALVEEGRLLCDGRAVSRTTYADLYAIIGNTYGAGDASTTFNLPDFQDRFPLGASSTRLIASEGGEEEHTLLTSEMPRHRHHQWVRQTLSSDAFPSADEYVVDAVTSAGNVSYLMTRATNQTIEPNSGVGEYVGGSATEGEGEPHSIMPPYLACYIYIRT